MAEENTKALLFKQNVRDPETFETFYAGVQEVEEGQADRLHSYHSGRVEETTEAVVKAAAEENVDLTQVAGSGSGGKVTAQDVKKK